MANCRSAATAAVISCAAHSPLDSARHIANVMKSLLNLEVRIMTKALVAKHTCTGHNWFKADQETLSIHLATSGAEQGLSRKGWARRGLQRRTNWGIRLWIMLRDQIDYQEFCRRGPQRQCGEARRNAKLQPWFCMAVTG